MNFFQGVRIVEIANYRARPYAGILLADLDADVIKVGFQVFNPVTFLITIAGRSVKISAIQTGPGQTTKT